MVLVLFRVPCYNAEQGCKSVVEYEGEAGSKPVRKICTYCQEHGAPLERSGVLGPQLRRKDPTIPKHFQAYGSEILYEITVWPKASYFSGGRVSNHNPG